MSFLVKKSQPVTYTVQSDTHDLWPILNKELRPVVSPVQLQAPKQPLLLTQRRQNLLLLAEHAGAAIVSTIVLVLTMALMMYGPSSQYAGIREPANFVASVVTPVAEVSYMVLDSLFPNVVKAEKQQ